MQNVRWDWDQPWLRYLSITVAYAAVYSLLHLTWFANWQLTTGFRLACLLLLPRRYWPALLLGEILGLTKFVHDCVGQLGLLWGLALPTLPICMVMPAVFLFRKYRPVIDVDNRVVISSLLLCILAASLLNTGANAALYALMQGPLPTQHWTTSLAGYFSYLWFLGACLGIYMVVPLTLWIYSEGDLHLHTIRSRIVRSRVLRESAVLLLAGLYLLAYITQYSHWEGIRHLAQVGMLIAPAWLAARYGWQGAALGCVMANLCVVLTMPAFQDATLVQTQGMMMASSTLWLVIGARRSVIRPRQIPAR